MRVSILNSILENLTITVPTISEGEKDIKFINPTGMDSNTKISEGKLDSVTLKYCSIKGLRLVNLCIENFIADFAVIKVLEMMKIKKLYTVFL